MSRLVGLLARLGRRLRASGVAGSGPDQARVRFVFGDGSAMDAADAERLEYITRNLYLRRKSGAQASSNKG